MCVHGVMIKYGIDSDRGTWGGLDLLDWRYIRSGKVRQTKYSEG